MTNIDSNMAILAATPRRRAAVMRISALLVLLDSLQKMADRLVEIEANAETSPTISLTTADLRNLRTLVEARLASVKAQVERELSSAGGQA